MTLLPELRADLEAAAERRRTQLPVRVFDFVATRPRALRGRWARLVASGTAVMVLAAAGAATAAITKWDGSFFLPGLSAADVTPRPESKRIAAVASAPAGGPAWGLEVSRSESGGVCTAVNRVHNGKLVLVTDTGAIRERAPAKRGRCSQFGLTPGPADHVKFGIVAQAGDIVFYGVTDGRVKSASLVDPDGTITPLEITVERSFIGVRRGDPESDPLLYRVDVTLDDGQKVSYP